MKKYLYSIVLLLVILLAVNSFAAVSVQQDGETKGTVERVNYVAGTVTRAGQTATVDLSALSGVNWFEVGRVASSGNINWYDVQRVQGNTVGINWSNWNFTN